MLVWYVVRNSGKGSDASLRCQKLAVVVVWHRAFTVSGYPRSWLGNCQRATAGWDEESGGFI